ncbi:MAG TPA: polyphosphate kinase 1 [Candidatus Krumholzibacteria bacterium]|nr:polyphosphate kinase 1 [Candidatus Krumholzibacteria bacterium]HPD70503.1 polyphosphate kinase 1 [Candidatus Krumholzibacteria bacterium]HRY39797.1 polyphosphate kinase 1 [Candidatus Krumholzibacteria bacterium]
MPDSTNPAAAIPAGAPTAVPQTLFLNRELSLLQFQSRVLEEATDPATPLLERVKFLAILGSNLDETVMVRMAGLVAQKQVGVTELSPDGRSAAEQLVSLRKEIGELQRRALVHWRGELRPALDAAGVHVLDYSELTEKQRAQAARIFHEEIFPVLTPQALDPGHPFPHVSNRSLNLAVSVRDPQGEEHFARLKVPSLLPRLVPLKRSSGGERRDGTIPQHHWFVWIEQLIAAHMASLFPGMQVAGADAFRLLRDADIEIQELEAGDLLETMSERIYDRQFGDAVRLETAASMPDENRRILISNLGLDPKDEISLDGPLDLSGLMQLHGIELRELKDPPFSPVVPRRLRPDAADGQSLFQAIRQGDILLHHPYESFDPVVELIRAAARDKQVLAIKQILYRVGRNSPVVRALLQARREYRKQVTVLVELKARFDEESNIGWARLLEREGVHVIYGMVGLKTHAKTLLIVRREADRVRRYMHLGTGNYNAITARLYEDFGLLTCDDAIAADVSDLFNYLTGYSAIRDFRRLLVAPINLRRRFTELIRREVAHQQAGHQGHLILKCNSLADPALIRELYAASQAGVRIDLVVRGICCLRPGVAGLSETIRVRSIVGRFLEHSRIYWFANAGEPKVLLGSADLMFRNLDRRVEVVFPISAPDQVRRLQTGILAVYLRDDQKARSMAADGTYHRVRRARRGKSINAQEEFLRRASEDAE